jgi:ATP-dependent exoDNAse (exonuclease V) beta subunit
VFALASSAEARRELYVDVTRAREDVTIAYGKDEVRDFGDLLVRAQRDQGKMLVRDVERVVNVRVAREQARDQERQWQRELQREPAPVIEQRQEGQKIDRDRGNSRGWGMGR